MNKILGMLLIIIAIPMGLYVGGWVLFVGGAVQIINGVTPVVIAAEIAVGLVKMVSAGVVGWSTVLGSMFAGVAISQSGD